MQSWNLNVQRELTPSLAVDGWLLRLEGHTPDPPAQHQPAGQRCAPLPGALGSRARSCRARRSAISRRSRAAGNSSYNALWVTANQRLARGLQFNASYTWSKSLDYNSLSSQGVVVQNSYDLRGDRGLSDFDARHRFVVSAIYELPFRGNRFVEGWQLAAIVQAQSGNPVNIVTSNSTVNGVANTLRPDVTGPINDHRQRRSLVRYFGIYSCRALRQPGPQRGHRARVQQHGFFDHQEHYARREGARRSSGPSSSTSSTTRTLASRAMSSAAPAFGRITNTRFPTGESGSSRQVQFAVKLIF